MSVVCGSSLASVLAGLGVWAVTRRAMGTLPCTPVISGDVAVLVLLLASNVPSTDDDDDDDDDDGRVTTLVWDSSYHTHTTQYTVIMKPHIIKLLTRARSQTQNSLVCHCHLADQTAPLTRFFYELRRYISFYLYCIVSSYNERDSSHYVQMQCHFRQRSDT